MLIKTRIYAAPAVKELGDHDSCTEFVMGRFNFN